MAKISIVTPSKNQGRFIERAIRSVVNQGFDGLQYIVIDGASVDDTASVLQRYDKYIDICVSEPDESHPHALVKGFALATGEILAYLNSDDRYCPFVLAEVWRLFQTNPDVDLLYSNRVYIDANDTVTGTWILPPHSNYFMCRTAYVPQETAFWRRSAYEVVGGIDPSLFFAFDYDLFVRLMRHGKAVRRRSFHAAFRLHDQSKTVRLYDSVGVPDVDRVLRKNDIRMSVLGRAVCTGVEEYIHRRSAAYATPARLQALQHRLNELDHDPA